MNTQVIQIDKNERISCQVEATLSFRPLIAYLKGRLKVEKTLKTEFYRFLLDKIEGEAALRNDIQVEDLATYKDTLELIFIILTSLMANEKDLNWALSTPVPDKIFFSTDSFYEFLKLRTEEKKAQDPDNKVDKQKKQLQFIYNMILERFYQYNSIYKNELLYTYTNPATHLTKYYNINADTQFIDIQYKGKLPALNFELLTSHVQEGTELELLQKLLPLNKFSFDGFSIISLNDVTLAHAINGIRDALVNHTYENEAYGHVIQALKTLAGDGNIEFGILPLLTVNNKFVFDGQQQSQSILLDSAKKYNLEEEEAFFALVDEYKNHPRPVLFNNLDDDKVERFPFLEILRKNGIRSYSFLPITYNNQLVGIMEIYARESFKVEDNLLAKLHSAMPLLGQLLQYRIEEFNAKMDEVLKDKFTALQPSVQWKFNEVVWDYLKKNKGKRNNQDIETVTFKNLYPLFGAVDIRNSTVERNFALKEDLKVQLFKLSETLQLLKAIVRLDLIDKLLFNCKDWIAKIGEFISSSEETLLNEFLEQDVYPLLKHIAKGHPETLKIIEAYFQFSDANTGTAFENRRTLETSMQFINNAVSEYLEEAQQTLQATYPCYFAKFRTDGVEYDIYLGQEIAPDRLFDVLYLKNIRLWQLTAMVEVARLTNSLVLKMPRALLTTQLIFIHSNTIDISFRNDERRFDVEGAYNIRYEVVKKRIDKVLIKGTEERLTQPGKIALVYFNHYEANEYREYISYLQGEGFLEDDLEVLELDELQGVSGLKALRVGVNYQSCDFIHDA